MKDGRFEKHSGLFLWEPWTQMDHNIKHAAVEMSSGTTKVSCILGKWVAINQGQIRRKVFSLVKVFQDLLVLKRQIAGNTQVVFLGHEPFISPLHCLLHESVFDCY